MITSKIRISTSNFIIIFLLVVFTFAFGIPVILDYSSTYKVSPIKVTIIKNCCDTGYCIKTLNDKIITNISTNDGKNLLKTDNIFFLIEEYDIFGCLVKNEIEWMKK